VIEIRMYYPASAREGSRHGVEEFVELKYMLMGGLDR
jgi:hypothetical protein